MKVVLHIGIEKTGTTAIQSFLSDNRKELRTEGFAYLESTGLPSNRKIATYSFDEDRSDDHHQMLGIVDAEPRKHWNEEFVTAFKNEIENLDSSIHTIVISNEQLHSRLERITEIERVKALLAPHCDEIEVLVYLRRQDQLATSLYSTALKCGHSFDTILPNVAPETHYYNFEILLNKWAEVFGQENIKARVFDKAELLNSDLLEDFLCHAGMSSINMNNKQLPGRQNESLEPRAQEYLRIANRHIPMMIDGRFNILRERITYQLESKFSGSPELPLRSEAETFCAMYEESNRRVAQKWFGRDDLFMLNFDKYPEAKVEDEYSFEDGVTLSAEVLNGITKQEQDNTVELLALLQLNPEASTKIIADYFLRLNPQLANFLRQNIVSNSSVNKAA